jgi:pimeloyl-ACP methyl ester carboxylesterase
VLEGSGTTCLVPVPALPSPQQRELPAGLRDDLELVFVHPEGPPLDPVDTLERAREACGADRVGLLGTSIWGLLCAAYARRFPAQTAFVVMAGTPPHAAGLEDAQRAHWEATATPELKALLEQRLCELEESGEAETVARNARAWAPMAWFDPEFDPSELLEGIEVDHEQTNATVRGFASISLPAVLPRLECPVLRVHGAFDYIVPPTLWDAHPDLGAHVTVRIFERSGHHPWHEEPDRFARELRDWIAVHVK